MSIAILALALCGLFAFSLFQTRSIEARFPPRGEFVDVDGRRIHVTRRAPEGAERANVVLVHGASGNQADMMAPLGGPLAAAGFRVFAVDRPGHGFSQALLQDASSPAAQAAAIRAALRHIGVDKAIFVGHSWAGSVAVNLLLDHADICDAALLLAPVTHPWPGGVRWYYELASAPFVGWLFAHFVVTPLGLVLMEPSIKAVFAPQPTPPDYAERTGAPLALRPEIFRNNARDVANLRPFLEVQAPRMGAIRQPVAIVTGDHDGIVLTERHTFGSARDIPDARLTMLKDVGHSPHWANPQEIVAQVEWLAQRLQSAREMRPETLLIAPGASSQ